jgi:hypothetical protein
MAQVVEKMAATNLSMVEAVKERNTIARAEVSMTEKDAELRKYSRFVAVLKDQTLSQERRNRLEEFCKNYENTM